ncbi:MAG: hypothetical protein CMJ18_15560 [Phycisphaeraceae bacterium]|nr:hypothetical protein [Phycisphaeraceae bacterium]
MTNRRNTLLLMLALISALASGAPAEPTPERRKDFGTWWIRNHPFTLMGLTALRHKLDTDQYTAAGFDTVFAFKNRPPVFESTVKAGLPYHYRVQPLKKGPVTDEVKAQVTETFEKYPGATGVFMIDEPKWIHMPNVKEGLRWVNETWPEMLAYSNANPIGGDGVKYYGKEPPGGTYTYEQYIDDFAQTGTDVLCFDIYPFRRDGETTTADYFHNLQIIRNAALKAGIPYWVIIQSCEANHPGGFVVWLPSESALRMQMFSSLAYGFTGIAYFCYDNVFERGLTEEGGAPNRLYYAAARVNTEAAHVGQALRFLTSRHILHVRGAHEADGKTVSHPPTKHTTAYEPSSARAWSIGDITIEDRGPDKDALLGLFEDDDGGRYFMIVNLSHARGATAAQRQTTLRISLDTSIDRIARLSRESGHPEWLHVENGMLELTLPGGTGDLLKIGDGQFPGLE